MIYPSHSWMVRVQPANEYGEAIKRGRGTLLAKGEGSLAECIEACYAQVKSTGIVSPQDAPWPGESELDYRNDLTCECTSMVRDNLNKDGLGFSGGYRWSFGGILCPRAVFRMLRLLISPHRGLVADLAGPPAAHRENLGALSPRQQVSRLSAVSRLPSPNSSARRSVFFARPR